MGVDLFSNSGKEWHWNFATWEKVLHIAEINGWKPSENREYYLVNGSHKVITDEALAIANALTTALENIPDINMPEFTFGPTESLWKSSFTFLGASEVITPTENFTGKGKRRLVEFIKFCEDGEFIIE
ncbi:MAG TPA: hypothetical protein VLA72_03950 [Anaerolineales bacterium]|nr:hypothetical protein [Anaerolineales bacterium]